MLKKFIVGIFLVTIIGAGAAAAAFRTGAENESTDRMTQAVDVQGESTSSSQQVNAQEDMGEPWEAQGTILELDANGFTLRTESGEEVYVELGPSDYWGSQGIDLSPGMQVSVQGTINDGMIHAYQTTLSAGETLQLRTEQGQPLWSGGTVNGRGINAGEGDGQGIPEPQAQVDEWITTTGTLIAFQRGSMTVSTPEGDLLTFQTGQPRFFSEQGVTFTVGDEVTLVGFFDNGQFIVGEITQNESGARVMLRDPNGRPLWAGPGSGKGNGNGNGGH